jgi:hypothetical protein
MGQMTGGTSGAILGGILGDFIGLQMVFILLVLPWLISVFYHRNKQKIPTSEKAYSDAGEHISPPLHQEKN